ncbi:ESX-1 secretion-associated protein [Mycolicibacterium sp.]|uniref:ESX-1 secretion-associated protein n=1 Tax=Mycolicibacterium sp. TaxID=2320850 RepID=UPI003D0A9CB8
MSRETLQVNPAHLRELAAKHGQAAAEIVSATETVDGVDTGIRFSHGVIAWSTAAAVEALQQARRSAGLRVADQSRATGEHLSTAADRYETTDLAAAAHLAKQIRRGPIPR